jgi:hypothetical protein
MSAEPVPAGSGMFATWTIRGLAVIGLLGCLAFVAIIVIIMLFQMEGPRRAPATVEATGTHEVFTVENINPVPHTDLMSMEVHPSDERADGSGYSVRGSSSDQRNIVLLNTVTGASRRILPDNHRHIDEYGFLPGKHGNRDEATGGDAEAKAAVTSYYLVIDQPGEAHLADLMVGSIAGERQAVVLTGIDGVDSVWMPDAGHVAVIVRDKHRLFYRIIDMSNFKVTASHPIAID